MTNQTEYLKNSEIEALVRKTEDYLHELHDLQTCRPMSWEWSNRLSSSLGNAQYATQHIKFAAKLWKRASLEERHQVIVHEVCHIIAGQLVKRDPHIKYQLGRDGHGILWQKLMKECGLQPDVCHTVNTAGVRRKANIYLATCNCSGKAWQITSHRVTKMLRGTTYFCKACGTNLKLI